MRFNTQVQYFIFISNFLILIDDDNVINTIKDTPDHDDDDLAELRLSFY